MISLNMLDMLLVLILAVGTGALILLMGVQERMIVEQREEDTDAALTPSYDRTLSRRAHV